MSRSLALRLAALSLCAQGCFRYVTPAYATVTVSGASSATVSVRYDEPTNQGIWLQHALYGPVWLPSEGAGSSSMWMDPDQSLRIGALAWSPALSQWVWLDAGADTRSAAYVTWSTAAPPTAVFVAGSSSNGARIVDDRFKPVRALNASITIGRETR